ncbi:LysR family transcriptional regulator [Xanthomonas arboricola pv. juglandis]|uniref:LysR family transcriptional regulator n=1 Tax=Xanthomonas TaxID=338 RepID=UPI000CEDDE12|nr:MULTISPECIES: LysR family transcriptional regulator [Xanthomonas]PPT32979.1 LysR family transcriptional regulator [Xanthomonas arboricola]SYZ54194.1 LysR family transcriptional regulator [Xanthomonas arboricola pv. juglandis]MBB3812022.1 DNA-binding transcriptional LysR family regulator [Xanthomonas euroxanthea]NIJ94419.1 DNA-binding transcriptional LysR family regulator [Xanthomonas euroxanthea]NIK06813.1 DNA-binding transcriptional LysR family regulator [Xanthomonas euroxanthea]
MNILQSIRSFVSTVDAGSIAGGAKLLGISAAAVSQNIARLEQHLGVRLLHRTTRSLALTERGTLYFEQVRQLERDLERARQSVAGPQQAPAGRLRVASTAAFARHVLAPMLPALRQQYPQLEIELLCTDRAVQHAQESVDVSLRIEAQLEDGLVARCIAQVPLVVCAAPEYLARCGTPQTADDLKYHDCLLLRYPVDGRCLPWNFVRNGVRFQPELGKAMVSDDIDALATMATAGGGIARLAAYVVQPYLQRGQLQPLFVSALGSSAQALPEPLRIYLCVADRRDFTPKVRAFMQHVLERLPVQWRIAEPTLAPAPAQAATGV